jgi:hypothetical protein
MATGTLTGFPINWSDVLASFGIGGLATPNVWSSTNKFTGTIAAAATGTTSVEISTSATGLPIIRMTYAAAAADQKLWEFYTSSTQFVMRTINDAGNSTSAVFAVDRSGVTPTLMTVTPSLSVLGYSEARGALPALSLAVPKVVMGVAGTLPSMQMIYAAGGTDGKMWDCYAGAGVLSHRMTNDAGNAAQVWMQVNRSAMAVSSISFPQGQMNFGGGGGTTKITARLVPGVGSTDGIRIDTAGGLIAQMLLTDAAFNYAGVLGGEAWFHGSGATNVNIGPDGAGSVRVVAGGSARVTTSGSTGATTFHAPLQLPQYTLATLPSAGSFTYHLIIVTNATGGAKLCFSNGTVWVMVYNNAPVG